MWFCKVIVSKRLQCFLLFDTSVSCARHVRGLMGQMFNISSDTIQLLFVNILHLRSSFLSSYMPVTVTSLTQFWVMFLYGAQTQGNLILIFILLFLVVLHFTKDSHKITQCFRMNLSIPHIRNLAQHWVTHKYWYFLLLQLLTHQGNPHSLSQPTI